MEDKFKFNKLKETIIKIHQDLPVILANQAQNYFVRSFDTQSWNGNSWEEVKRRIEGTPEYKYPLKKDLSRRTRPILIGKGSTKLRRATSNSVRVKTWPIVRLIVDLPYAKAHNEGLGHMPKRQFMGITEELNKMHKEKIKKQMDKLKKFD